MFSMSSVVEICCRTTGVMLIEPAASELILAGMDSGSANYSGLLHPAAANARHADPDPPGGAFHNGMNALQIRVPAPLGQVVGVADTVAAHRFLAANFTHLSHNPLSLTAFRPTWQTRSHVAYRTTEARRRRRLSPERARSRAPRRRAPP